MFYDNYILARKGPLARIWVAAHYDKKLSKAQIYEVNIHASVAAILSDKMRLALRTSGHLLLGVVRIYSRQIRYLLADCNDAYAKIRLAFRPGIIDLPVVDKETATNAVTIPADFMTFDDSFLDEDQLTDTQLMKRFDLNQGLLEEITLKEKPHIQRSDRPNFDDKFGDDDDEDGGFILPVDLSKMSTRSRDRSLIQFDSDEPPPLGDESALLGEGEGDHVVPMEQEQPEVPEESEMLHGESAPLDLEPIEPPAKKARREMLPDSSKVAVDPVTELTGDQIRRQLSDCSGLIEIRPVAPPTRYHAAMQESGVAETLIGEPLIQCGTVLSAFLIDAQKTKIKLSRKHDETTLDLEEAVEEDPIEPDKELEEDDMMLPLDDQVLPPEDEASKQEFDLVKGDEEDEVAQEVPEESEESGHRRFSRATDQLLSVVQRRSRSGQQVSFLKLSRGLNRQQAAMKFYSVVALVLEGRIVTEQTKPFADISIRLV